MKQTKLICLLALMVWGGVKNVDAQILKQWNIPGSGGSVLNISKIRVNSQGNAYTLATYYDGANNSNLLTQKINTNGVIVWSDTLAEPAINAKEMQVDASGNVYSFGQGGVTLGDSAWLVKYSPSGVKQWVYTIADVYIAAARIRIDNAGNVVIGYEARDTVTCWSASLGQFVDNAELAVKFLKISPSGSVVMNFKYQPAVCSDTLRFFSLNDSPLFDIDASGNIYFSCSVYDQTLFEEQFHIIKVNSSGGMAWNQQYFSHPYADHVFYKSDLKYDPVNQHVLTSFNNRDLTTIPETDVQHLIAVDNAGALLWDQFNTGIQQNPSGSRIETDGGGNAYWGYYPTNQPNNFTIKKISPTGVNLWSVVAAGLVNADMSLPYYDQSPGYAVDNAGNLYYYEWYAPNYDSLKINKYSPAGSFVWQYSEPSNWGPGGGTAFISDANSNLFWYNRDHITKYIPCTGIPTIPSNITTTGGIAKVCPFETRTYTVTNVAGYTFNWVVPAGAYINSGQGTNSITVYYDATFPASGTLSVSKVNSCGSSTPRNLTISRNNPAATITTNGGPTTFCSGTNPLILTANAGTGYTYQWKKGNTILAGATNQSYVPTSTSTAYKVVVTNAPGCSKTSANFAVTVNPLPAATITPQGPTTFCAGGSVVLAANSGTGYSYQWKKGANLISGATLQNYTASTAGTYKVIVTNSNSCSKTSAGTVVTVNCREGKLASDINTLDVFPNPVNGMATIKVGSSTNQSSELSITDITGRVMLTQNIDVTEGENNYTLDLSTFSSGVYLVKIKTGNNVLDKRIIIN